MLYQTGCLFFTPSTFVLSAIVSESLMIEILIGRGWIALSSDIS